MIFPHGTYFIEDQIKGDFGTRTYAPGAVAGVETVGFRSNAPAGPTISITDTLEVSSGTQMGMIASLDPAGGTRLRSRVYGTAGRAALIAETPSAPAIVQTG